jgi:small subunit ribosomal protein S17
MIRGSRKTRIGRVVSDKMDKSVVVAVEWRQPHRLYSKSVKHFSKFHVHDQDNGCKVGDMVTITETRPLSKTKRWRVTQILSRGDVLSGEEISTDTPEELEASNQEAEEEKA